MQGPFSDKEVLRLLHKCQEFESVAVELLSQVQFHPVDESGCVSYVVHYQHRDCSHRGRLFAVGNSVKSMCGKFPRTTTLQGMHSDLRAPLVGAFAHDIDCVNSEIRLLCSLAEQLKVQHLIKTMFLYRDDRQHYIDLIRNLHGVSELQAKRLPTIILSGGTYGTWAKATNVQEVDFSTLSMVAHCGSSFLAYKLKYGH
jgi:hypothetical protein